MVSIVAGLVSIDRGKRLDQGKRQPVPAVPIIDRGNHPRPSVAGAVDRRRGLVTSIDQGNRVSRSPRSPW